MTLHTYNSQQKSLPSINFLHLTVSEIEPGQDIIGEGHYGKVKRSNQGHTKMFHTYNPQPMSQPHINFLHLTVSEI